MAFQNHSRTKAGCEFGNVKSKSIEFHRMSNCSNRSVAGSNFTTVGSGRAVHVALHDHKTVIAFAFVAVGKTASTARTASANA